MQSWFKDVTSRVQKISESVFNSENDGDTEDDTHVCRVLREYYTEKGTGWPQWLPPDPNKPPPVVAAPPVQQQGRYGAAGLQASQSAGGLSSLWDKNRAAASAPPGANPRNPFAARNAVSPDPVAAMGGGGGGMVAAAGGGGGGGNSIQDRLRNRLAAGGARTTSPGSGSSGPFAPPPAQRANSGGGSSGGDYDPYRSGSYDSAGSGGGRAGGLPSGPRRMGGLPSGPRMRGT